MQQTKFGKSCRLSNLCEEYLMEDKKVSPLYRIIKWLIWLFYPKMKVMGQEHLPEEPCIIVGNQTQMKIGRAHV